jgi:Ser/Thr protein kinase RdoA (MazF antagonist)
VKIEPIRPEISGEEVSQIVEKLYGLAGEFQELASERDRNFLLTSETDENEATKKMLLLK